jgi:peptide-methionine (R)-S-oxide reductase
MMSRRNTVFGLGAAAAALAGLRALFTSTPAHAARSYEVAHSDAEWKNLLTPEQFSVLRKAGTERPYSSPLNHEKRAGTFVCAACALPLFSSKAKFESGTGWPSFYEPLAKDAVDEVVDNTLGMRRVEVLCHRCGGHLGHVFDDGPRPTGLRYCMNGLALKFNPNGAKS